MAMSDVFLFLFITALLGSFIYEWLKGEPPEGHGIPDPFVEDES